MGEVLPASVTIMPGWAKAILIIVGTSIAALIVLIALVVRYVGEHRHDIQRSLHADGIAGSKAGEGKPQTVCVDATLAYAKQRRDVTASLRADIFFTGCIQAAEPTPDFCAPVPDGFAPQWKYVECRKRGMMTNTACLQVMELWRANCRK